MVVVAIHFKLKASFSTKETNMPVAVIEPKTNANIVIGSRIAEEAVEKVQFV